MQSQMSLFTNIVFLRSHFTVWCEYNFISRAELNDNLANPSFRRGIWGLTFEMNQEWFSGIKRGEFVFPLQTIEDKASYRQVDHCQGTKKTQ